MQTYGVKITWLGHAAFRMESNGKVFYFDPFLTQNPKCPEAEKHPTKADFILLSHGHDDHVGDTLEFAKRSHAKVVCIYELGAWLVAQGLDAGALVAMNKGGTIELGGAKITMVDALHSSGVEENGTVTYLGDPAGYVVEFNEGLCVYFAGDTAVFGDMRLIAELYKPDVACLPIGDFYTMGTEQAAHACKLLGVKAVIPMHWGTFPGLSGTPEALRELTGSACEVVDIAPGQTISE